MRKLLTTTAIALTLLVPSVVQVHAQDSGAGAAGAAGDAGSDTGGTTGLMTTTPGAKTDDAAGTQGETVLPGDVAASPATGVDNPISRLRR